MPVQFLLTVSVAGDSRDTAYSSPRLAGPAVAAKAGGAHICGSSARSRPCTAAKTICFYVRLLLRSAGSELARSPRAMTGSAARDVRRPCARQERSALQREVSRNRRLVIVCKRKDSVFRRNQRSDWTKMIDGVAWLAQRARPHSRPSGIARYRNGPPGALVGRGRTFANVEDFGNTGVVVSRRWDRQSVYDRKNEEMHATPSRRLPSTIYSRSRTPGRVPAGSDTALMIASGSAMVSRTTDVFPVVFVWFSACCSAHTGSNDQERPYGRRSLADAPR
jgi:hypothetical protein